MVAPEAPVVGLLTVVMEGTLILASVLQGYRLLCYLIGRPVQPDPDPTSAPGVHLAGVSRSWSIALAPACIVASAGYDTQAVLHGLTWTSPRPPNTPKTPRPPLSL